jgi:hypothetical protein
MPLYHLLHWTRLTGDQAHSRGCKPSLKNSLADGLILAAFVPRRCCRQVTDGTPPEGGTPTLLLEGDYEKKVHTAGGRGGPAGLLLYLP